MEEARQTISLKHGEKKILKFTYTEGGVALSIAAATLTLTIKEKILDAAAAMTVSDGSFTKAVNIARCTIDTSTLKQETTYLCEIKAAFGSTSVDKSETFDLKLKRSVDGA
jgi:hypothetical protein